MIRFGSREAFRDILTSTVRRFSVAVAMLALGLSSAAGVGAAERGGAPSNEHSSLLTIASGTPLPASRRVSIGVNKSMLVEFPVRLTNVLVSNPDVLDAVVQNSNQVYLLAKDIGEANAIFLGPNNQKLLFLEVSIARDLTLLSDSLRRLVPGSDIKVEMIGENIVLSGSVLDPADASRATSLAERFSKKTGKVVNLIKADGKEQVHLRIKVAEMSRDAIRRIGVDWPAVSLQSGNFSFAKVLQNAFPVTSPLVSAAVPAAFGLTPLVQAGTAIQPTWKNGNQTVTTLIQLLERRGLIKTLAEPNLTAISGETAKFLAGGEFPVPISQTDNRVTVEYKQFGVNVSFRPVVMSAGRISLKIAAEVSEISNEGAVQVGGLSIPALKVRRAETTLELPSGGTLAMAGLLSDETRQSVEGVPGLKTIPMLGALFRSNDYRRRESELVILVTPYLAKHATQKQLAEPGQNYSSESELKELLFGRLNRIYGNGKPVPPGGYKGDYGFIIEYPDSDRKG
ncbi:MAG: type II and III secretion system protein family protein [Gammaproteobacteria bacterium]